MRVLGADISLNHSGFVVIDGDGSVIDYHIITEKLGIANRNGNSGTRWKQPVKSKDNHLKRMARLAFMKQKLSSIYEAMQPDLIVLEGYAFDTHGAHQMGELGGCARLLAWELNIPQRWHDPLTLKMFACHKGNATKEDVQAAVKQRWNTDFNEVTHGAQGLEDLCDAYVLAIMGVTEMKLRSGAIRLSDLHAKEIQVFNRVTRASPINILGREFICSESA